MDDPKKPQLTVREAIERLEEFRRKLIDSYQDFLAEGEIQTTINIETLEAIEVVLYYLKTLEPADDND